MSSAIASPPPKICQRCPSRIRIPILLFLREGRWIDEEDDKKKKNLCVINEDLAKLRGVSMADLLSIDIKSTEEGYLYLVTDKDRKEWKEYPHTGATDCEVVGIFGFKHALKSTTRWRDWIDLVKERSTLMGKV